MCRHFVIVRQTVYFCVVEVDKEVVVAFDAVLIGWSGLPFALIILPAY